MFLINSCQENFHCGRVKSLRSTRQALSLTYGRFFAEFLEDISLVRLGLLALTTCVGLRYGSRKDNLRSFSWKRALPHFALSDIFVLLEFGLEASIRICQDTPL